MREKEEKFADDEEEKKHKHDLSFYIYNKKNSCFVIV